MTTKDFQITFKVDQSPAEVYNAIKNVPAWWNARMKGKSTSLDDEFSVQFDEVHYSKHKIIELVEDRKVVWSVADSKLTFLKDMSEWNGTQIVFELFPAGKQTALRFTHEGLTPEIECFKSCSKGWSFYLDSLHKLISTGKGEPFVGK